MAHGFARIAPMARACARDAARAIRGVLAVTGGWTLVYGWALSVDGLRDHPVPSAFVPQRPYEVPRPSTLEPGQVMVPADSAVMVRLIEGWSQGLTTVLSLILLSALTACAVRLVVHLNREP